MAMNHVRFIAITKFAAGVVVVLGGYGAGVWSQSPTVIAFLQFFIGALIPTLLFWRKMKQLLVHSENSELESAVLSQVASNRLRGDASM
jgi:hypothetical protein